MFGNLFNEDSVVAGLERTSLSAVPSIPQPPAHRADCMLAGIANQGATCYLNSLLQTLLYTPEFREKLFALTERELGSLEDREKPGAKVRVIPLELQRLFAKLLLSDQQSVGTVELTNSFGWTNHEEFQQHDVQELNRILFSAIEDSLLATSGQNIINQLYHGTLVNQIVCLKCKNVSEREEDFLDLTLAIAGVPGLESALKQCYQDVETMDGRNQYKCEKCDTYTDATKGAKIRKLPSVLTVSLLRFSFDFVKMTRYKENGRFTFPMELDMKPYSENEKVSEKDVGVDDDVIYQLFSVVVHRGGAHGGHYFAFIRDIDNLGHWSIEKDAAPRTTDPAVSGLDVIECQSPVDLVENILGQLTHRCMSVDRLCAEISKVTGVSWNKRYKKSHGPINKFLKNCSSFDYNPDTNWVSLRSSGKGDDAEVKDVREVKDVIQTTEVTEVKVTEVTEIGGSSAPHNSTKPSSPSKGKRASSPEPDAGEKWFCFNDSHVAAVSSRELEKQFSGKESAYMLFYRLKSLKRPSEASGDRAYCVPHTLVQEVEQLNTQLKAQRQSYETAINTISIKVFHQEDFLYDGLLRYRRPAVEGEERCAVLQADRRGNLDTLRGKIAEHIEGMPPQYVMHNFCLHIVKPCCGGYHLFEELEDVNASLQDLGLTADSSVFVWNGAVISNEFVRWGAACEPVLLICRDPSMAALLGQVAVAKDRPMSEVALEVARAAGANSDGLTLSYVADHDSSGSGPPTLSPLPRGDDVTLADTSLRDGGVVVLGPQLEDSDTIMSTSEKSNCDTTSGNPAPVCESASESANDSVHWSITLQERLSGSLGQVTCHSVVAKTRPSVSVGDLKVQAMTLLQVNSVSAETVRLREDHRLHGLQPPLRETLTLAHCGLSDGATVVLESGRPPGDTEMTVGVNFVVAGKLVARQELLVDRGLSVASLLQAASELMAPAGQQCYLCKTDVYGDPADSLENMEASLEEEMINDGDTLMLQPGTLVRKDELSLSVWLVDGEAAVANQDNNGSSNEVALTQLMSGLLVPKAMSVDQLKQALLATSQFQELMIPTHNFMRLRTLEGGGQAGLQPRFKGLVRANSQVLRHANHKEGLHLAVQVLKHEESLGVHEILLRVAQKVSGTRVYLPAREFVWNAASGSGAADLKRSIATAFDLQSYDVLLAKYNPDTCVWTVLRDAPSQKVTRQSKHKSKKKAAHKTNIRQAPYFVQDGDLIGVKMLSGDKGVLDTEDFSTQDDIDKRLLLQQLAEEKKRIREERKKMSALDGFPAQRRPEVALTIKVDKFS